MGKVFQSSIQLTVFCLSQEVPVYDNEAHEIDEKLDISQDYPVSKGSTSPFTTSWIIEMDS
ncbi:hypothetical protein [Algoriphagus sp. Y33]|uniref:hypothetical protein n=1 Tax=Algoriphagus sp. Y33 TaxID=2772483 RepID=UPI00177D1AE9|nr:hypothetical protein [Algoriphagus sp. Y33]